MLFDIVDSDDIIPGGMTKEHKDTLDEWQASLVDLMDPLDAINKLQHILTERQTSEIRNRKTRQEQVECLLDYLRLKSDSAFDDLVKALDATKQAHLSLFLNQTFGNFYI